MFDRILIAVDGSPYSQPAISSTIEIARKFRSQVFVLHVREHEVGRAGAFPLETPQDALDLVAATIKTLRAAGITAAGDVRGIRAGHVAQEVVDAARAHSAELIIMGSRGLSDMAGLFVGSVTHKVLQLAHTPVLVVRPPVPPAEAPVDTWEPAAAVPVGPMS